MDDKKDNLDSIKKNNTKEIAENLFQDYYNQLKEYVGEKTTYSSDLNEICKLLFGKKFLGVYAYDKIPKRIGNKKGLIFNLDKSGENSKEHWCALYKFRYNKFLFYDSFGRDHALLLPDFKSFLKGGQIHNTELDAEQIPLDSNNEPTTNCGLLCVSFLSVAFNHKVKFAKLI